MYYNNYKELKKQLNLENKFTFNYNIIYSLLPLRTRSIDKIEFKNGCLPIIGAFSRLSLGKQIKLLDNDEIVFDMLDEGLIEFEDMNDKSDFDLLIHEYLGGSKLNIIDPILFLYVPLGDLEIESVGMKMAQFINVIFFKDINFADFFKVKPDNQNNIIIDFIVSNLKELKDESIKLDEYFIPKCMEDVVNTIRNDFLFLLNHEEFLVKNFDLIMAFYLNFYFTQFVLKNNLIENSNDLIELYYFLDWEKVSTDRGENLKGFKLFEKYSDDLLYSMVVVEHLNMLLGTKSLLLSEIYPYFENLNKNDKKEVLKYFKKIIIEIIKSEDKLDDNLIKKVKKYDDFKEVLDFYENDFIYTVVKKLNRKSPFGKYSDLIMKLSKHYFVKKGGRNGNMFNITQEMLMIITAISIQNEDKIRFNRLIYEFKKRGLFFDRESQKKIMDRFNTLNLIDAKSDIGEEAYVKSIL